MDSLGWFFLWISGCIVGFLGGFVWRISRYFKEFEVFTPKDENSDIDLPSHFT